MAGEVRAAGGVLWRPNGHGGVELALVHRPRYDDWSLPKGKLEPDEEPVLGALREVQEETGMIGRAGRRLGTSSYEVLLGQRWVTKKVDWWAIRALSGEFVANAEVDALRWCSPEEAKGQLTAGRDLSQVELMMRDGWDLSTALLMRHADAGGRADWPGHDDQRPLSAYGIAQAQALAGTLPAFGVTRVVTAPALRCAQTVAALAHRLGLVVEVEPLLSDAGYGADPQASLQALDALLAADGAAVCSQGGALPALLADLAQASGVALGQTHTHKAGVWVLSLHDGALVSIDKRPPPL